MIGDQSARVRVMLVDDHSMVRVGLATVLQGYDDLELAGEAASGEEAIQRCAEMAPDVILMDMALPRMSGTEAIRLIRSEHPTVQVLVLTSYNEGRLVMDALEAGAIGYLLKDVSASELVRAIRAAHIGRATLSPQAAQGLVAEANLPPKPGLELTPREREVLTLMVEGLNNGQIGERLTISASTVKSHVSHVLSKLDVATRTEAVTLALRQNIVR